MGRRSNRDLIENTLGWTSLLRGDLFSEGALQINGWVEGSVECRSAVVIGASGAVRGRVLGADVVVAGKVLGNVICSGHLEILATGRIEGDVEAQSVRVEAGGVLLGTTRMGQEAPDPTAAPEEQSESESESESAPERAPDRPPELLTA